MSWITRENTIVNQADEGDIVQGGMIEIGRVF